MDRENIVKLDGVTYRYSSGASFSIDNVSFGIKEKEIFGLLGPSGAGKSTLQKFLTKLIEDYSGSIEVFGEDLRSFSRGFYERIGVSFELPNHYLKLTAKENLEYFKSLYSGKTRGTSELLALVGLENHANELVENFSKGMKNRLTLARSLLNDPEILFLDEPTSGLDPVNKENIIRIILEMRNQGKTIFLTTHDMDVVDKVCDRVGFIINGRIELIGEPRRLKLEFGARTVVVEYLEDNQLTSMRTEIGELGRDQEFQRILREYQVESIHSQEATLDQVFIEVTGSALR